MYPLQPLRIPAGWRIQFNSFYEVDPDFQEEDYEGSWEYFNADMFCAIHEHGKLVLDLGWYPEGQKSGRFMLLLVRRSDDIEKMPESCESPLRRFETTSPQEVVEAMEN